MKTIDFDTFAAVDIRAGKILRAENLEGARKPAYKLQIDFGKEIGTKWSSAQITDLYKAEDLIGKTILAVVNLEPKRIAGFKSEVLVLGVYGADGVVLIAPTLDVQPGDKLG